MKTMICLLLDRSGSMKGRENDVVGGVNSLAILDLPYPSKGEVI